MYTDHFACFPSPKARPSPPRNCSITSSNESNWVDTSLARDDTSDTLVVRCVAGYDGGLPQLVVLEAIDSGSGSVKFNVTVNETGKEIWKWDMCLKPV